MHVTGMVHVNVNCSDYERSLAFYRRLGFEVLWEVPETNTPEVAAAVGMPPYRVRGALLALAGAGGSTLIDLLEWREPRDESPPYPHLYHLGLARIALATSDLDADVAELEAAGVELLSAPARVVPERGPASRFVCFKDPDGTVLELVEMEDATRTRRRIS
jgi:catechol 2,3-dioxygenase-like lactoylglutathione lyase family enzyme